MEFEGWLACTLAAGVAALRVLILLSHPSTVEFSGRRRRKERGWRRHRSRRGSNRRRRERRAKGEQLVRTCTTGGRSGGGRFSRTVRVPTPSSSICERAEDEEEEEEDEDAARSVLARPNPRTTTKAANCDQ